MADDKDAKVRTKLLEMYEQERLKFHAEKIAKESGGDLSEDEIKKVAAKRAAEDRDHNDKFRKGESNDKLAHDVVIAEADAEYKKTGKSPKINDYELLLNRLNNLAEAGKLEGYAPKPKPAVPTPPAAPKAPAPVTFPDKHDADVHKKLEADYKAARVEYWKKQGKSSEVANARADEDCKDNLQSDNYWAAREVIKEKNKLANITSTSTQESEQADKLVEKKQDEVFKERSAAAKSATPPAAATLPAAAKPAEIKPVTPPPSPPAPPATTPPAAAAPKPPAAAPEPPKAAPTPPAAVAPKPPVTAPEPPKSATPPVATPPAAAAPKPPAAAPEPPKAAPTPPPAAVAPKPPVTAPEPPKPATPPVATPPAAAAPKPPAAIPEPPKAPTPPVTAAAPKAPAATPPESHAPGHGHEKKLSPQAQYQKDIQTLNSTVNSHSDKNPDQPLFTTNDPAKQKEAHDAMKRVVAYEKAHGNNKGHSEANKQILARMEKEHPERAHHDSQIAQKTPAAAAQPARTLTDHPITTNGKATTGATSKTKAVFNADDKTLTVTRTDGSQTVINGVEALAIDKDGNFKANDAKGKTLVTLNGGIDVSSVNGPTQVASAPPVQKGTGMGM